MIGAPRRRIQFLQMVGRRKVVLVSLISLICYGLLRPLEYTVSLDVVVPGVEPSLVWEFLADFNNMKKLNPTIEHFSITSDNGDYHRWEYGVEYTEHLSNLPFIKNLAHAHFKVYKSEEIEEYVIDSEHRTCFFGQFFCVDSKSKFICHHSIQKSTRSAYCRENVTYECPRLASLFCHSEVMFQRRAIFKNLVLEFSSLSGTSRQKIRTWLSGLKKDQPMGGAVGGPTEWDSCEPPCRPHYGFG